MVTVYTPIIANLILNHTASVLTDHIQRDLEASTQAWTSKLGAQESFSVQCILISINSDK